MIDFDICNIETNYLGEKQGTLISIECDFTLMWNNSKIWFFHLVTIDYDKT